MSKRKSVPPAKERKIGPDHSSVIDILKCTYKDLTHSETFDKVIAEFVEQSPQWNSYNIRMVDGSDNQIFPGVKRHRLVVFASTHPYGGLSLHKDLTIDYKYSKGYGVMLYNGEPFCLVNTNKEERLAWVVTLIK